MDFVQAVLDLDDDMILHLLLCPLVAALQWPELLVALAQRLAAAAAALQAVYMCCLEWLFFGAWNGREACTK
jgi:hypothetical protein